MQRAQQWVNSLKGKKRERARQSGDHMWSRGLTVTLHPLVFTFNSHFHFNSRLLFTHLPTLFLHGWERGRRHSQSVEMWLEKQPGGMDTGNQWVNKTADWVNNLEERPSRGSYVELKILLHASYTLCAPTLKKNMTKIYSGHMRCVVCVCERETKFNLLSVLWTIINTGLYF